MERSCLRCFDVRASLSSIYPLSMLWLNIIIHLIGSLGVQLLVPLLRATVVPTMRRCLGSPALSHSQSLSLSLSLSLVRLGPGAGAQHEQSGVLSHMAPRRVQESGDLWSQHCRTRNVPYQSLPGITYPSNPSIATASVSSRRNSLCGMCGGM